MGKVYIVHLCCGNLLDSLHFSFVSLCRIQAEVGCFFLIRMQSTWCSHGISGLVAIKETSFGGRQWDGNVSMTIKQISSMPDGFSSLSGKYLPMHVLGGFERRACCLLYLKEGQWWERSLVVHGETVALNERVPELVWGGKELVIF